MDPSERIRHYLRFDVARLRASTVRLQSVHSTLQTLRERLEARAGLLAREATEAWNPAPGQPSPGVTALPVRTAQAQATAELARRAALGEVLRHSGALPLIATMAVARWVEAILNGLPSTELSLEKRAALAKGHIDAGRLAHRMLATLRPRAGLRSGCGQLVCAVVVAELAPPDLEAFVAEEIEDGWVRALGARGVLNEDDALRAASCAVREACRLLESMTARAAPAAAELVEQAEEVEARVARELRNCGGKSPLT